jgi:ribonuclease HI
MSKNKFYVVWIGREPGIYDSWEKCKKQIEGFAGAKYKGFTTYEQAKLAFQSSSNNKNIVNPIIEKIQDKFPPNSIAVDAAVNMKNGIMEYRGIHLSSMQIIFHVGPLDYGLKSNNIAEFLALVHGLQWLWQYDINAPIYSDSHTAITWVKNKKINSKVLEKNPVPQMRERIENAINWLKEHPNHAEVRKWNTSEWGEIPADFNRK